jgi:hypothetical protein
MADPCNANAGRSPAVNGAMFPHQRACSNFAPSGFILVFQVLGCQSDRAEREKLSGFADAGMTFHHNVRDKLRSRLNHNMRTDGAERTDFDAGTKLGTMSDNRGRMNAGAIGLMQFDVCHRVHEIPFRFANSRRRINLKLCARSVATNTIIVAQCFPLLAVTLCFA